MQRQRDGSPRIASSTKLASTTSSVCQSAARNSGEPAILDVVAEALQIGVPLSAVFGPLRLSQMVQATG